MQRAAGWCQSQMRCMPSTFNPTSSPEGIVCLPHNNATRSHLLLRGISHPHNRRMKMWRKCWRETDLTANHSQYSEVVFSDQSITPPFCFMFLRWHSVQVFSVLLLYSLGFPSLSFERWFNVFTHLGGFPLMAIFSQQEMSLKSWFCCHWARERERERETHTCTVSHALRP